MRAGIRIKIELISAPTSTLPVIWVNAYIDCPFHTSDVRKTSGPTLAAFLAAFLAAAFLIAAAFLAPFLAAAFLIAAAFLDRVPYGLVAFGDTCLVMRMELDGGLLNLFANLG